MGLFLVALSHKLSVGSDYSLGRAAVMFAVCGGIIAYGFFEDPYAPIYCFAFVTPIFPTFGTGLALIAGGTLLVLLNRKRLEWQWQFSRSGLLFCLWSLASLAWGEHLNFGQESFVCQAGPAMILAIVISGIRDPSFRRNLMLMVTGACVIGSAVSFRNWATGRFEDWGPVGRTYSMIVPDVFSAWCLFGLFGALAWLLAGRPPAWLRWILVLSTLLILLGIGLCGFRAAIVAVGFGVVLVGICLKRVLQGLLIVCLIAAVALGLYLIQPNMFAPVLSRFQTIQEDRGSDRLDIWEGGLKVFRERPLWGVGCDNFKFSVERYYGARFMPHSIYVGTLAELGVIGVAFLLLWMGVLFRKTWRAEDRLWVFPLIAVYLLQAAFLHQFYFSCFWIALGLAEGARARTGSPRTEPGRLTQRPYAKVGWFPLVGNGSRHGVPLGGLSSNQAPGRARVSAPNARTLGPAD
jgi:hypothetical protein